MSRKRPSRKEIDALCNDQGSEDGLDPRYDRDPDASSRPLGRKTLQLCSQVAHTLMEVLAGSPDAVLRDLEVVRVTPAGAGRLLVILQPALSAAERTQAVYTDHLLRGHPFLRQEVAGAIHRRKTPDLLFQVNERKKESQADPLGEGLL
ncbi:MAG: hypothetical protein U0840_19745 [Gemmataceae bacterium]